MGFFPILFHIYIVVVFYCKESKAWEAYTSTEQEVVVFNGIYPLVHPMPSH